MTTGAVLLGLVGTARAAEGGDPEAPSLAVESDRDVPVPRIGVALDPVALLFEGYGLTITGACRRRFGLLTSPRVARRDGATGFGVDLGALVFPLGRGLEGPWLGVRGGLGIDDANGRRRAARVGAEAGYTYVGGGIQLGVAAGYEHGFGAAAGVRDGPRFAGRAFLGIVFH